MSPVLPLGSGRRLDWHDVPRHVQRQIELIADDAVVDAVSQPGGFSPGLAARLELADGRRVFAKAVDAERQPIEAEFHRRESATAAALPASAPAPRLLGSHDDGDWVALVFEDVEGWLPAQPWRPDELHRVLHALTDLADVLTPAPADISPVSAHPRLGGWSEIAADGHLCDRLTDVAPEVTDQLERLCDLESGWRDVAAGRTLAHLDAFPHNIVMTSARVMFVDWPHARVGAAHLDLLTVLISAAASGFDPEPRLVGHPLMRGVDPAGIDVILAAQAGFMLRGALETTSQELDRIPVVKRALGRVALAWLRRRLEPSDRAGRR